MPKFAGLDGRALGLAISTICTCGFLLFGYDQGVMSGIITDDVFVAEFPETKDNSVMQGTITALYDVGCLMGAISILFMGDILGRRRSIMTGCLIMLVGVVIQVTSFRPYSALTQFIIGRIVTGVGNGINTSTIPTYQAECSRTTNRGLLICIQGGSIAFGTLIAYWLNFGISYVRTDVLWRFPISFQCVFALTVFAGIIFLPESPRWLLSKGRYAEGTAVIAALHGESIDSPKTQLEKRIILDSIQATSGSGAGKIRDMFTNGKTQHLRRVWLGASSQLMQQIGGCNAVIYYVPILFQSSIGLDRRMSLLLGGINATVYAISATGSWFVIEKMGRRKLFLWGTVGQMLSMVIAFACLLPGSTTAAKGAAVGLFLYIASFGTSWLPLPWLYPAEINPLRTRTKANAVSTIFNWGFNTLVVMVTPIMVDRIGWGTYLFFAAINALFLPFIYFYYPETRRRSLEEIDIIFAKGYTDGISYVRAAKELPYLKDEEIEEYAIKYGFVGEDAEQPNRKVTGSQGFDREGSEKGGKGLAGTAEVSEESSNQD